MEAAAVIDDGHYWLGARAVISSLDEEVNRPVDAEYFNHNGTLIEWIGEARYGIGSRFEGYLRLIASDFEDDGDPDLYRLGGTIVSPQGSRKASLSDVVIGVKRLMYRFDRLGGHRRNRQVDLGLSLLGQLKIPIADEDDFVSSGETEFAGMVVVTDEYGPFIWHFNAGINWTNDIDTFLDTEFDLKPAILWGVSAVWAHEDHTALILQIQGNTNAFRDYDLLDSIAAPLTGSIGGRHFFDGFYVEAVGTAGLSKGAEDSSLQISVSAEF
jgi:hypothetical protein